MAVESRSGDLRGTVPQQVFRVVIVRAAGCAALQRLGIAGQKRCELVGIVQMQQRNVDGVFIRALCRHGRIIPFTPAALPAASL
jgi:hypothetical protein